MFDALNNFEIGILESLQSIFKCGFLDFFFPLITKFADSGIGWIIVALLLLLFKKTRKTGLMVSIALIIGLLTVNCGLKPLIGRIRPYDLNEAMKASLLVSPLHDGSFPSGHTLASFEAATVLMMRDKRFGVPALVLALLIALSRLYLCVHYPSDVIVATLLGVLYGVIAVILVNRCEALYKRKKSGKAS